MTLVGHLIEQGVLENKNLIKAFESVDRRDFLPDSQKQFYLENRPLPIGCEQTNSQPFTVAFMLELLLPEPEDKVLEVGCGSGWVTALIAQILDSKKGFIYATEIIPELKEQAETNLEKYSFPHVKILDSTDELGLPDEAPFTKIIVSASASEMPQELIAQLAEDGRLVIPVNESIFVVEKSKGELKTHEFEGFRFVELIH